MEATLKIVSWLLAEPDRSFTIRGAAEGAEVSAMAMRSFFERHRSYFLARGREDTGRPGGTPTIYGMTSEGANALRERVPVTGIPPAPVVRAPDHLIAAVTELV